MGPLIKLKWRVLEIWTYRGRTSSERKTNEGAKHLEFNEHFFNDVEFNTETERRLIRILRNYCGLTLFLDFVMMDDD